MARRVSDTLVELYTLAHLQMERGAAKVDTNGPMARYMKASGFLVRSTAKDSMCGRMVGPMTVSGSEDSPTVKQ